MHKPFYEDPILQQRFKSLLDDMGQDSDREGLKDTPRRWLKFMYQFLNPEPFEFTTFNGEDYNEMILVKDIPFFSLCEHHMAPFFGVAHVAYIPNDRIVGLSKIPRAVDHIARRLQNQERITKEVVSYLDGELMPRGVACVITARHLCVEMRGVKKHNVSTTTSAVRGAFKTDAACRSEFMSLIK